MIFDCLDSSCKPGPQPNGAGQKNATRQKKKNRQMGQTKQTRGTKKTTLGQHKKLNSGQKNNISVLYVVLLCCCCVVCCVVVVLCMGSISRYSVWVLVSRFGLEPPFPWTAQNFALFFLSRHISFFLPSLGVFSWNFGGVFEDRAYRLSGCRVKPRRPHRATVARTRQPKNSKRTTKIQRKDTPEREERMKIVAGEGSVIKNWPKSNWPKSKLAEVEIGRSRNWPNSKFAEVAPEGWGSETPKGPEGWGPEGWGPKGWGPKGWGPKGWGEEEWGPEEWEPRRVGAQKPRLVGHSRNNFHSFSPPHPLPRDPTTPPHPAGRAPHCSVDARSL